MKYLGGKTRIRKKLIALMDANNRNVEQTYVEPFVGGANVICKVQGKRIAADVCPYLIALLKAVAEGWRPEPSNFTAEMHKTAKHNKKHFPLHITGYLGYICSFRGAFFGGYAKGQYKQRTPYIIEAHQSLIKQADGLKDVQFINTPYYELEIPENSLIYCDPPLCF